ncbi:hypothetical protein LJC00_00140 [Dysgonomonas sp. OttesenSCG-928-M03]|nr:hypothetical protein [Dysgonomonas sp. OttesenSCG-928-M03]
MDKINISRNDVLWGYVSQICNVGANLFILPVLFYFLSSEILGIWYVFMNIGTFVTLFGLVFQSSFSRNISYAFSGATSLQKHGINTESEVLNQPNLPLIKSLIITMRRFYGLISVGMVLLLLVLGIPYFRYLTQDISNSPDIILPWILYSLSVAFGFYCLYFGSILQGRGYIKELNQLIIINKSIYIVLVFIFISNDYQLWGLAIANIISVLVQYITGHLFANKNGLGKTLKKVQTVSSGLMRIIWHNTYKLGFATLLNYLSTKGNLFYVSLFLPLGLIAQYGLTLQVVNVLSTASMMYFLSYTPLVAQSWIMKDKSKVKNIYSKSLVILLSIFSLASIAILLLGDWALNLIGSNTTFLPTAPLFLLFIVYLLDTNHSLALNLIVSRNNVPQLKASIISAISIYILIPVLIIKLNMGIYGVIFAVGIVQICYQNWKWPQGVSRILGLSFTQQLKLGVRNLMNVKIKPHE